MRLCLVGSIYEGYPCCEYMNTVINVQPAQKSGLPKIMGEIELEDG